MSVIKYTTAWGLTAKPQATRGVAEALVDADYLLLESKFTAALTTVNDGARGMDPRTGASMQHVRQSGATIKSTDMKVGVRENSAGAFTALIEPHDLPRLYRAHGMTSVFDATAASWTYQHDVLSSTHQVAELSMGLYAADELWGVKDAVISKMAIEAKAGALVVATFAMDGVYNGISDATYPNASTYNVADEVVKFDGSAGTATIGAFVPDTIESFKIESDRSVTQINSGVAAGVVTGFALGAPTVKLSMTIKGDLLSNFNPHTNRLASTIIPVTIPVGVTGSGRLVTYSFPVAQLLDAKVKSNGNVAMWDLSFVCSGGSDGKQGIVIKHS